MCKELELSGVALARKRALESVSKSPRQDLVKAFQDLVSRCRVRGMSSFRRVQEKGIDWIVEEMRPMDAEALHRPSEGQQNAADVS